MEIVSSIVDLVDKYLIAPLVRRIKILKNSSENVKNLQDKVGELKANSSDRQHKFEEAEIAGQVETDTASNWFTMFQKIEVEATVVQQQYDQRRCARGWCVNCWSLYKLSKRSVQLTRRADDMLKKEFDLSKRPPPKSVIEKESEPIIKNQPSTQRMLNQLLDHISDPNIGIIGVYGMGGVGKTTLAINVNNHFIGKEIENFPFNTVIMVTVSATPDIPSIRTKISKQLGLDLSKESEDGAREKLFDTLKKKKYLLILDDVWSKLELSDVGIPHPRSHKGSKILITSRHKDTCTHMDANIKMQVQRLSRDESWNLFVEKAEAGQHVTTQPIKGFAETIVGKCDGLPLAIVTVARAMADRDRVAEWADAVKQMERPATNSLGMKKNVYDLLRFSFDRLEDDKLRSLFLYCACFPEDYNIGKYELLNFCVGDGLVDESGSLVAAMNKGEFLIGSLKIASMLEDGEYEGSVRMHDMMRDLGHYITSSKSYGSPKFLIRTGESFKEAPHSIEWVDATKISLFNTQIEELPQLGEKCQNLTTLLLSRNSILIFPQIDFLEHMDHLSILDLYGSKKLEYLPDSFSCLENLRVLRLRYCSKLRALPALGMLRHLQVLDLCGCDWLDQQILTSQCVGDAASNLRYLNVEGSRASIQAREISRLLKLVEVLNICDAYNIKWRVRNENEERDGSEFDDPSSSEGNNMIDVEELSHLPNLTSLSISFQGIGISDWFKPLAKVMNSVQLRWCTVINQDVIQALNESQDLQELVFRNCSGVTCVPTCVQKELYIINCKDLEVVLDGTKTNQESAFQKLETFCLYELPKLERICVGIPPLNCFGQLKALAIIECDSLKMVFTKGMPAVLNNLEKLKVERCRRMEVIIEGAEKEDGELEERRSNNNNNDGVISPFPKLRKLELLFLPSLTDVCPDLSLHCPCLQYLVVEDCPKLTTKDPLQILKLPATKYIHEDRRFTPLWKIQEIREY